MNDSITNPRHYNELNPQPWDVCADWSLDFFEGNILKYLARAGRKQGASAHADITKALTYARKLKKLDEDSKAIWSRKTRSNAKRVYSLQELIDCWSLPKTLIPSLTGIMHISGYKTTRQHRSEAINLMITYLEHAAEKELE